MKPNYNISQERKEYLNKPNKFHKSESHVDNCSSDFDEDSLHKFSISSSSDELEKDTLLNHEEKIDYFKRLRMK